MRTEQVEITFSPLSPEVQRVMQFMFKLTGGDPIEAYAKLVPAMMMMGAVSGMDRDMVKGDVEAGWENVEKALETISARGLARLEPKGTA